MKKLTAFGLTLICIGIAIVPIVYLMIDLPADVAYAKTGFQGNNNMIHYAGSFQDLKQYINNIWTDMNATFGIENHKDIYNTWWGPDQSYDNSLAATDQWI